MPEETRPWTELETCLSQADGDAAASLLDSLPGAEVARAVLRLSEPQRVKLMETLAPKPAAEVVNCLPDTEAAALVAGLAPRPAAAILAELHSDDRADLISGLDTPAAEAILAVMPTAEAADVRALSSYAPETAGGLMVTEMLVFPKDAAVGQVVRDMRTNAERYADFDVQYTYVIDADGRLVGVLRLRDLLLARDTQPIGSLMIKDPLSVPVAAGLDELRGFFEVHDFLGVPVVDQASRLVGVLRARAVEEALAEKQGSDYRKSQGIIAEELRTMPLFLRSRRRLAWLSINIVLNLMAASIIAVYQGTLEKVIALAVFLPIISDMSGCSGNQAIGVSMRELSLGLVKPAELFRVLLKEASLGLINGSVLGLLIGLVAWFWKGNAYLGLVVGGALAINTVVAVSLGGSLPLLLKRFNLDPALASGPILTTVTDMCGFFLALSFAAALIAQLQ